MSSDVDERFLAQLAAEIRAAHLDAVVVGNVAALLQDAPVLTQDVDLLVRDTPSNRRKLRDLARRMGGVGPHPISELTRNERITGTDVPIDVLFDRISGNLRFEALKKRAVHISFGKHALLAASLKDVIRSKEATGRPKDVAALPILQDTLRVRRALNEEGA